MPLVEVSHGNFTSAATTERLVAWLEAAGKVPVRMKASPGYIVPRIQALAMNEAARMVELVEQSGLLHGYLENQLFAPHVEAGKALIWARGAATTGRPYLARAAEEHSVPHMPWFWQGRLQGGGVLNDMMCHSVEEARFMLTPPGAPRSNEAGSPYDAPGALRW